MRRSFFAARNGGISVLTALSTVALIGCAGLATDVGAVYLESRRLQGAVDLAALAAMQDPRRAQAAADASLRAAGFPHDLRTDVTLGVYTADRAIRPQDRFSPGAAGPNAVQVVARTTTPLYFGRLFMPRGRMAISRRATAAQGRLASFQIGTRLLALRGGVANEVLGALAGSEVNLSVMDYNALLNADVDLLSYVEALRTRLDLEAASFDETLSQNVTAPQALGALADVLDGEDRRAARAIGRVAESAQGATPLNRLIDLGPYGPQDYANHAGATRITVKAMDLATAILEVAGGDRQVKIELNGGVPGLAQTNVWLAIGERPNQSPWLAVTDDEDVIIRTAQMRLYIEADIRPAAAAIANVRVPILLELASGRARLEDIECGLQGQARSVTLGVSPGIGSLSLGQIDVDRLDNFRGELRPTPAELVRVAIVRVEGEGRIEIGGQQWTSVRFDTRDIERGAIKSVATGDAARATVSTLLGQTELRVRAAGLGVSTGAITSATQGALTAAAAPLDDLLNGLTELLGVRLGEADVRVNGVRCTGGALVS